MTSYKWQAMLIRQIIIAFDNSLNVNIYKIKWTYATATPIGNITFNTTVNWIHCLHNSSLNKSIVNITWNKINTISNKYWATFLCEIIGIKSLKSSISRSEKLNLKIMHCITHLNFKIMHCMVDLNFKVMHCSRTNFDAYDC